MARYNPGADLPIDDLAAILDGIPDDGHRQIVQLVARVIRRQSTDLAELDARVATLEAQATPAPTTTEPTPPPAP